ncbi:hypothetical protein JXA80_02210 [bacterium]|nr:hypothetical protein [candidate division CSSED10-310 bacterium]
MAEYAAHPFVLGLAVGVCLAAAVWVSGWLQMRKLKMDMRLLKEQLQLKMELDAEATANRKAAFDEAKERLANLQSTIHILREKPGRRELELLHIYDRALQKMFQNAPGFASAWQSTLELAEKEFMEYRKGIIPFMRRVIRPSSTGLLKPGGGQE